MSGAGSYAAALNGKQHYLRIGKWAADKIRTKAPDLPDVVKGIPVSKEELAKCDKDTWYGLRSNGFQYTDAAALMQGERGYLQAAIPHFTIFVVVNDGNATGVMILMKGYSASADKNLAKTNLQTAFSKPLKPQAIKIDGMFDMPATDSLHRKLIVQRVGMPMSPGHAPSTHREFYYNTEYTPTRYSKFGLVTMPNSSEDPIAESQVSEDERANTALMPYEYIATSNKHATMAAINIRRDHNAWTVAKEMARRFQYVYVKSCSKILVQDDKLTSDGFVKACIKDIDGVANAYRFVTETTYIWPLAGDDGKTPALLLKTIDGSPIYKEVVKALEHAGIVKFIGEPLCRSFNTWLIRTDDASADRYDGFTINGFYILSRPGKGGPASAAAPDEA